MCIYVALFSNQVEETSAAYSLPCTVSENETSAGPYTLPFVSDTQFLQRGVVYLFLGYKSLHKQATGGGGGGGKDVVCMWPFKEPAMPCTIAH